MHAKGICVFLKNNFGGNHCTICHMLFNLLFHFKMRIPENRIIKLNAMMQTTVVSMSNVHIIQNKIGIF